VLMLLGWAAVSAAWAPEPTRVLDTVLRLGFSLALALLAADALREACLSPIIPRAAAVGLALGISAALFDDVSGNALRAAVRGISDPPPALAYGLKNAASVIAFLLPIAVFAPAVPTWARISLAVSGCAVVLLLPGESAKLAVLAGLACAVAASANLNVTRRCLAASVALIVLGFPLLLGAALPRDAGALPNSAVHRLLIWDFAAERIAERPVLGWGMESSRTIPGGAGKPDPAMLDEFGVTSDAARAWFQYTQLMPLHPHNLALQVWLELGVVGALLMALLLAMVAWHLPNAAGCGVFAAALVIAMLSYGAWQYWWVAGLLLAAVTVNTSRSWYRSEGPSV